MILTYRYRLLPSKRQHRALEAICESQRQLYNAALEERIDCYRKTGRSINYIDQYKSLTLCRRALPEMGELPVTRLARLHRKIADTRNTWLHQQSAALVNRADLIAVEDLNVKNMIRHPTLARSIADASWSKFLGMLAYKVEKTGGHLIRVDPRNTSQKCSGCNELVPKSLAVRIHACPHCGLVIDRDWNASLNILQAGIGLWQRNVSRQVERAVGNICEAA
jgi:IS605 OrfB family transposase